MDADDANLDDDDAANSDDDDANLDDDDAANLDDDNDEDGASLEDALIFCYMLVEKGRNENRSELGCLDQINMYSTYRLLLLLSFFCWWHPLQFCKDSFVCQVHIATSHI